MMMDVEDRPDEPVPELVVKQEPGLVANDDGNQVPAVTKDSDSAEESADTDIEQSIVVPVPVNPSIDENPLQQPLSDKIVNSSIPNDNEVVNNLVRNDNDIVRSLEHESTDEHETLTEEAGRQLPLIPCANGCQRKCADFDTEHRMLIRKAFWSLSDGEQKQWLKTKVDPPEKSKKKSRHKNISEYFLPHVLGFGDLNVCRSFFLNTLGLKSPASESTTGIASEFPIGISDTDLLSLKLEEDGNCVGAENDTSNPKRTLRGRKPTSVCKHCGMKFPQASALQKHIKRKHEHLRPRALACRICEETFTSKLNLNLHMDAHESPKKKKRQFNCPKCNKTFGLKASLDKHAATHWEATKPKKPASGRSVGRPRLNSAGGSKSSKADTEQGMWPKRTPILDPCSGGCRRKCSQFSANDRKAIWDDFWSLSDAERTGWIAANMYIGPVKSAGSPLNSTETHHWFFLPSNGTPGRLNVCKAFFRNTLGFRQDGSWLVAARKRKEETPGTEDLPEGFDEWDMDVTEELEQTSSTKATVQRPTAADAVLDLSTRQFSKLEYAEHQAANSTELPDGHSETDQLSIMTADPLDQQDLSSDGNTSRRATGYHLRIRQPEAIKQEISESENRLFDSDADDNDDDDSDEDFNDGKPLKESDDDSSYVANSDSSSSSDTDSSVLSLSEVLGAGSDLSQGDIMTEGTSGKAENLAKVTFTYFENLNQSSRGRKTSRGRKRKADADYRPAPKFERRTKNTKSTKRTVPLAPCSRSGFCRRKCGEFSVQQREKIRQVYWELSRGGRAEWLNCYVRRAAGKSDSSLGSRKYFLPDMSEGGSSQLPVCGPFFMNTLGYKSHFKMNPTAPIMSEEQESRETHAPKPGGCPRKKCSRQCRKYTDNKRAEICRYYWSLSRYARREWLQGKIKLILIRAPVESSVKRRESKHRRYFLPNPTEDDGPDLPVCPIFFYRTLGYEHSNLSVLSMNVASVVVVEQPEPSINIARRLQTMPEELCPICGKCIAKEGNMKKHISTHTGEKPFACHLCGKCYTQAVGLRIHMDSHAVKRTTFNCNLCEKVFYRSYQLKAHLLKHQESMQSDDIPANASHTWRLSTESADQTSAEPSGCGATSAEPSSSIAGTSTSTTEPVPPALPAFAVPPHDDLISVQLSQLEADKLARCKQRHPLVHTKCNKCGRQCHEIAPEQRQKIWENYWSMKRADRIKWIGSMVAIEPVSTRHFSIENSSGIRREFHKFFLPDLTTGSGQIRVCQRFFRFTLGYRAMTGIDGALTALAVAKSRGVEVTGEEKRRRAPAPRKETFPCPVCAKELKTQEQLKAHAVVHADQRDRPFKCALCGKGFLAAGYLKQHMAMHEDIRPFACTNCSKRYRKGSTLREHILRHHTVADANKAAENVNVNEKPVAV